MSAPFERGSWSGRAVSVREVAEMLTRLHAEHNRHDHAHGAARTLNLVVPCGTRIIASVGEEVERLGTHNPARTVLLHQHEAERLDAEVELECDVPHEPGRVGICHDRVLLHADAERLAHATSLLAPLLMADLPRVVWLPHPGERPGDPELIAESDHVVLDSAGAAPELEWIAELAATVRVHDLAWGRLDHWRAATAAAWDPPERRLLLPRCERLEVRYRGERRLEDALLLAGWVLARARWSPAALRWDAAGGASGEVSGPQGTIAVAIERAPDGEGPIGLASVTFAAAGEELPIRRAPIPERFRDRFAQALSPLPTFNRGYGDALAAASVLYASS